MSKLIDYLLASVKSLRLKEDERRDTRAMLEARMRFPKAFRILDEAAREYALLPSEKMLSRVALTEAMHHRKEEGRFRLLEFISFRRFISLVSAVLIVFTTGGGVLAYAAEDALPGETLYAVKVSFNEPAIAFFQRTPQAKARWAGKKLERRLLEAEKLAQRESLVPEIEEKITFSLEQAEQEAEHNTLILSEKGKREEFRERLKLMKERQKNIVRRFKEKRSKKQEILLLREGMRDTDDGDRSDDNQRKEIQPAVLSSSGSRVNRKQAVFSSSMPNEEVEDKLPLRIRHQMERPPKFKEIIRSRQDSSSSEPRLEQKEAHDSSEGQPIVPEDFLKTIRKIPKQKMNREKSL